MRNGIGNTIVGLLVFIMVVGCGSASKKTAASISTTAMDELVESKHFKIEVQWARPMMTMAMNNVLSNLRPPGSGVNQINIMGDGSFFKMDGDYVAAELSYFGERQMGGPYDNAKAGISFEGIPEQLEITEDGKRKETVITFNIEEKLESYRVSVTVTPKLNGRILVSSSHRNSIWYTGKVSAVEASEE